jgi:hypothetical protein
MEDTPPAAAKLKAVLPDDYHEDAATAAALVVSLAEEEAKWSWLGLEDIVQLSVTSSFAEAREQECRGHVIGKISQAGSVPSA